jgi:hypothetical protein
MTARLLAEIRTNKVPTQSGSSNVSFDSTLAVVFTNRN